MKEIGNGFTTIWKEQRGLVVMMAVSLVGGLMLLIFSLASLNPNAAVTRVGYGDFGGYRDGSWQMMLMFPLFALLMSVVHSLIAVKVFMKNGKEMAMSFVAVTLVLEVLAATALIRLIGEG